MIGPNENGLPNASPPPIPGTNSCDKRPKPRTSNPPGKPPCVPPHTQTGVLSTDWTPRFKPAPDSVRNGDNRKASRAMRRRRPQRLRLHGSGCRSGISRAADRATSHRPVTACAVRSAEPLTRSPRTCHKHAEADEEPARNHAFTFSRPANINAPTAAGADPNAPGVVHTRNTAEMGRRSDDFDAIDSGGCRRRHRSTRGRHRRRHPARRRDRVRPVERCPTTDRTRRPLHLLRVRRSLKPDRVITHCTNNHPAADDITASFRSVSHGNDLSPPPIRSA